MNVAFSIFLCTCVFTTTRKLNFKHLPLRSQKQSFRTLRQLMTPPPPPTLTNAEYKCLEKTERHIVQMATPLCYSLFRKGQEKHKALLGYSFVFENIIRMVLLVSSFRKINLIEKVLFVSSSHMQSSYEKAFSFFPCKG